MRRRTDLGIGGTATAVTIAFEVEITTNPLNSSNFYQEAAY
jgi:hypothetical protein